MSRQCERGFFKQHTITSHLCIRLNLKTLDALMRVSLCGLEVYAMDWATIFKHLGETCKTEGHLRLIDRDFFLLQIKIAYRLFKILVSLKYCVRQN